MESPVLHAAACGVEGHAIIGDNPAAGSATRLMATVDVHYRAVLQTLVYAESSLASESLMRGLIEAWAHLDYIWSDGHPGSACRALAIELGWLLERRAFLENAPTDLLPGLAAQRHSLDSNLEAVEALRRKLECRGGARRYGNLNSHVNAMARRPGLAWLLPMWKMQSEAVHLGASDWLFAEIAEGRNDLCLPSPGHRATWCHQALALYYNVAITTLRILGHGAEAPSDDELAYVSAFRTLFNDAPLRELIDHSDAT